METSAFDLDETAALEIHGPDRAEFLHRLLTSAVKAMRPGQGQPSLLLDVRGKIQVAMDLLAMEDRFLCLAPITQLPKLQAALDRYRFAEKVSWNEPPAGFGGCSLQGPLSAGILHDAFPSAVLPEQFLEHRALPWQDASFRVIHRPEFRGTGFWILADRARAAELRRQIDLAGRAAGLVWADVRVREALRVQAGLPKAGKEIDGAVYPAEVGLESACALDKGCYVGQEVVAKMTHLGDPPRRLVRLRFEEGDMPLEGWTLRFEEEAVGSVSSVVSPMGSRGALGLGLVRRERCAAGTRLVTPSRKIAEIY